MLIVRFFCVCVGCVVVNGVCVFSKIFCAYSLQNNRCYFIKNSLTVRYRYIWIVNTITIAMVQSCYCLFKDCFIFFHFYSISKSYKILALYKKISIAIEGIFCYCLGMLIDDVTIKVSAGNGGRGAVAFNKNVMSLGPAGGSGGKGGSVYVEGVSDLSALNQFRYKKDVKAENGGQGRDQFRDGASGSDLVLKVPVGTVIKIVSSEKIRAEGSEEQGRRREVLKVGEKILVASGGLGGKGNFLFRSPRNTSPERFQKGLPGEHFTTRLELKLIADIW